MARGRQRPDQIHIPSIAVPMPTEYESLREMQVRQGSAANAVYVAHKVGERWLLLHKLWPSAGEFLVKEDGSLWGYTGREYDRPLTMTLKNLLSTGDTAMQCESCGYVSLPGANRHRRSCPPHP